MEKSKQLTVCEEEVRISSCFLYIQDFSFISVLFTVMLSCMLSCCHVYCHARSCTCIGIHSNIDAEPVGWLKGGGLLIPAAVYQSTSRRPRLSNSFWPRGHIEHYMTSCGP